MTLAEGLRFERRIFHGLFATNDQKEGAPYFDWVRTVQLTPTKEWLPLRRRERQTSPIHEEEVKLSCTRDVAVVLFIYEKFNDHSTIQLHFNGECVEWKKRKATHIAMISSEIYYL